MAEPFVMIRKPAGKIAVTIGTKQINDDGQQALLQDIELRIHDSHQYSCLVRNLSCAPNTQNYEHRQDHHDEGQSPYTSTSITEPSARAQVSRKDANRIPATITRKLEDVCQTRRPTVTLNAISAVARRFRAAPSDPAPISRELMLWLAVFGSVASSAIES
jgi:hypothetical protein